LKDNPLERLERNELIDKLKNWGYGDLVQALLENEGDCFTKRSRLNKSGTCRTLGWKNKQLEDALAACREILKDEFKDEFDES
jgi:hypothetical protein